MASGNDEYIVDQLLAYLNNPLFQAPIDNFMDSNCIIFDPSQEDCSGYKQVHNAYKNLIDMLLEGFRQDTGLTADKIIQSLKAVNKRPEIRDVYRNICDQVIAMDDYSIFVQLMTQRNIEIQHQALLMIIQQTGGLPESLTEDEGIGSPRASSAEKEEESILQQVLEQSKKEYEKQAKLQRQEDEELQMVLALSRKEANRLDVEMKAQQEKTNEMMKKMSLDTAPKSSAGGAQPQAATAPSPRSQAPPTSCVPPPPRHIDAPPPAAAAAPTVAAATASSVAASQGKTESKAAPPTTAPAQPVGKPPGPAPVRAPPTAAGGGGMSGADAAKMWMQSAQQEASANPAVQAMAASMSGMSQEELKRREAFLKQQRDKLVEMKRKEREKQLQRAEASQPQRPVSARVARAAMQNSESGGGDKSVDPEEEKKLAMRRAIANRIKTELMVPDQAP